MDLKVSWTSETSDGLFGKLMVVDGDEVKYTFVCDTNKALRILDGEYSAKVDMSPRLKYLCPHLKVPDRDEAAGGDAGLRIHKANEPKQSLGCIFPGESVDGDAVDDSKDAFNEMMKHLPQDGTEFSVVIESAF